MIRCLLIVPNPESALNEDAGKLLLERSVDCLSIFVFVFSCCCLRAFFVSVFLLLMLLLHRYEDYAERARLMTSIHAKHPGAKGTPFVYCVCIVFWFFICPG